MGFWAQIKNLGGKPRLGGARGNRIGRAWPTGTKIFMFPIIEVFFLGAVKNLSRSPNFPPPHPFNVGWMRRQKAFLKLKFEGGNAQRETFFQTLLGAPSPFEILQKALPLYTLGAPRRVKFGKVGFPCAPSILLYNLCFLRKKKIF